MDEIRRQLDEIKRQLKQIRRLLDSINGQKSYLAGVTSCKNELTCDARALVEKLWQRELLPTGKTLFRPHTHLSLTFLCCPWIRQLRVVHPSSRNPSNNHKTACTVWIRHRRTQHSRVILRTFLRCCGATTTSSSSSHSHSGRNNSRRLRSAAVPTRRNERPQPRRRRRACRRRSGP